MKLSKRNSNKIEYSRLLPAKNGKTVQMNLNKLCQKSMRINKIEARNRRSAAQTQIHTG